MTNIQIFEHSQFGKIDVAVIDGKEHFAATECAKALGYANPRDAILRHCRYVVKHDGVSETTNQHGKTTEQTVEKSFIPEGDVYRLIVRSNLPEAEKFERWVFDEVLPSIRKHGAYLTPDTIEKVLTDPDTIIKIATQLKEERQLRLTAEAKIAEDKPKVLFSEAVATSKTDILIGEFAKILKQNGKNIGQNRLFQWMRENGYLCSKGELYNSPTQRAMDLGLFRVKETTRVKSDGHVQIDRTTKVTGKGQIYFVNRFLGKDMLSPEAGGEFPPGYFENDVA